MTRVLALADQSKIGCITQRRFAKVGTKTHPQRGAALDRNGLSVSTETACRFEPKSPVGNSEICIRTHPPPSRLRLISRVRRLYGLPCSDDFAPGRGGLLQLLSMSLSPCCRFHPAEVNSRIGQSSAVHAAFALRLKARPSGILTFEATTRSLLLRPGDSQPPPGRLCR